MDRRSGTAREGDILIVGAGMAGLMAALELAEGPHRVIVVDKGKSVGGRLATRRVGAGRADHGAQFFTVRDSTFGRYVERWLEDEIVFRWSTGWSDGSLATAPEDGHRRYAVRGGMNALARHLAMTAARRGVQFEVNVRLTAVHPASAGWEAEEAEGRRFAAAALVLTPPVPQSLQLLHTGTASLSAADSAALAQIDYAPCLCGLFLIEGETTLPDPGALQRRDQAVTWIADNRRKGISPEAGVLTVHAGPEFSRIHFDDDDAHVLSLLRRELASFLAPDAAELGAQLKRWRYALPMTLHPGRFLEAEGQPLLFFGGDAFGGPRMEGAALSGLAVAAALRSRLSA